MASTFSDAYSVERAVFLYDFLVFDFESPSTYYTSTSLVEPLYHAHLTLRPSRHWSNDTRSRRRARRCDRHWSHGLQTLKSSYTTKGSF